jgi:F-type H+-transporting ATPase subunit epsilon
MLNNHAPIISSLVNGTVKVKTTAGNQQFEVKGGVVEMLDNKITLLAESV